jgi:DsbC/DsbD-like thiol-disulfide interchange protein
MTATVIRAILMLALASAFPAEASAARSNWSPAAEAQLRLLLAGPEGKEIAGGIEIMLTPGWHTYWRNPGEAGVPPVFDFSGSDNVAKVEVSYPAPERLDDGTSVQLVYKDGVVFPLAVTPAEPGRPVTLRLRASFGVCREVCIPASADAVVTLPPAVSPDPLAEAIVEPYRARVPKPPEPGRFDVEKVALDGGALVIDVRAPESSYLDLFAEAPEGWYIGQPTLVRRDGGISRYRLPLDGRPRDAAVDGQRFRFVAVAGGEAVEKAVDVP